VKELLAGGPSLRRELAVFSYRLGFVGFRSRAPGPPPFSSMNSMQMTVTSCRTAI